MLRIKASKKMLTILAVIAVGMLVVVGFTCHNRMTRLHSLQTQIDKKQDKLTNSESIARRLETVEQEYEDAKLKLSMLEQGVSTKAYVPTLLRQVEALGKSDNLRVVGVRPKVVQQPAAAPVINEDSGEKSDKKSGTEAKKAEPYDRLDIDLEMTGQYKNVVRFLSDITYFPKIITVNAVQIAPENQVMDTSSPTLTVRLNTTAFILKQQPAQTGKPAKSNVAGESTRTARVSGGEI